jgi:hypothetical protein
MVHKSTGNSVQPSWADSPHIVNNNHRIQQHAHHHYPPPPLPPPEPYTGPTAAEFFGVDLDRLAEAPVPAPGPNSLVRKPSGKAARKVLNLVIMPLFQ